MSKAKNNSILDSQEIFRKLLTSEQKCLVWIREVFSASSVVLFVSHQPHFCYELPCPFTVAICVRGLPSLRNPWANLVSITMGLNGRSIVNEAWICVDRFNCTPPTRSITLTTKVLWPMSSLILYRPILRTRVIYNYHWMTDDAFTSHGYFGMLCKFSSSVAVY